MLFRSKLDNNIPYKIYLHEEEIPKQWYNVRANMKEKPAPLLNPVTKKPMTAEELGHVFCDELVQQELDNDTPYIDIPTEIRDFYKMYRPSPLVRAYCLQGPRHLRPGGHPRRPARPAARAGEPNHGPHFIIIICEKYLICLYIYF